MTASISMFPDFYYPTAMLFLAFTGAALLLNSALKIAISCYKMFLRPSKNLVKLGKYAVVTGATDGIGKAYAMELARKGMSILLISRTESKLQEVKKEIDAKNYPNVDVKYLVCDFSTLDEKTKKELSVAIEKLDVGILVNNVGISYRYPMFFHELSDKEVTELIEMNVHSTVWMTRFVLQGMLERRRGAIVNISSGSAMYTLPLLAEYSGSKSFIEKLTLGLNAEYSRKGIAIQCQIPFYVSTKLAKMRASFSVPAPNLFARRAIRYIGHFDPVVSPYWVHGAMGWFLDHLPASIVTGIIMKMHMDTRKRGLKKDAASTKKE